LHVQFDPPAGDLADSARPRILCIPARSDADEVASLSLAHVLEARDCFVQAVSAASLTGEVDPVEQYQPDVVCISATSPAAAMHGRYLCKRLRARFPRLNLVVGLWDTQGDLNKAKERIGCDATVVATFASALEHIDRISSPPLPQSERPAVSEYEQTVRVSAA
jgi:DNA-binding NarL/FixJ family response regulator